MPSKSKAQQKFMGMVHSLKKGDTKPSDVSKDVKDAAKSMSKKDAKDYASTKHKGLPNRVKQEILDRLKTEYAFYHTQTRARKRDHDDDNNLGKNKKYSGQPDLEEGMVQPKRGHDYFQLTKDVELDYISGHTGLGLTTPGVILHNTISQFKGKKGAYIIDYHGRHFYVDMKKRHYMDILPIGNKYQKKLRWNSNYKSVDMAPEYSDWKNYKSLVKKENVVKNHEGEHLDEKLDLDMLRPHQKSMLATLFNQFGKRKGYTSKNIGKKASEQEIKDILKRSKPFIRKTSSQYKQEFRDLLHALKGFREGVNEEPVSISMRNDDGSITTTIKEKTSETIDRNFRSYDNHEDEKDDEGTVDEGMFSTIDQIRQDSKNVRDFVKNVFKDRDFMKMKNDKEFIKYLKSIYEGKSITEVGIFPVTNYISGIIPQGRLDTNTPEEKRKSAKLIGDLKKTLNTFWKKNDIPFKIK